MGLYSRGLIIEGAYTRDFTVFELIYQVNMVDLGSLCSFSKKTKMTSFIKDMNINVYGLSEHAKKDHIEVDFSSNTAVIMGSEEHGIRKKTKEICDQLVRLSSNKDFKSFNVSVATGIILSEILRQRKC